MAPKASSTLFLLPFLFVALSSASDITQVLSGFPEFSAFSNLLTQTKLVDEINKQGTVTVLAVDASALGATKGLPPDVLRRVLSVHVILDYYDADKIQNIAQDSITLTTLYQSSGTADQKQGFVNLSKIHHWIKFGSAVPGASQDSELINVVVSKPSTLSVLQVSSVIVPPGIDKVSPPTTTSPPPAQSPPPAAQSPPPAQSPAAAKAAAAATPVKAPAPSVFSPADAPSSDDDEDRSPAGTPQAGSPEAQSPEAESPQADSPEAESPQADSPVPTASAASPSIASSPAASGPSATKDEVADAPKSGTGRVAASTAGIGVGVMGAILLGLRVF